jgi:hypothetical protein
MAFNLRAVIKQAAKLGPNMNIVQAEAGGDFAPPELGLARARLVAYLEMGKHEFEYEGKTKTADKVNWCSS